MSARAPLAPIQSFRALAGALMSALVVIGIAVALLVNQPNGRNGTPRHPHAPDAGI